MDNRILHAYHLGRAEFPRKWELITDVESVQDSLRAVRKNSISMGWKKTDSPNTFRGDFRNQTEVRNNIYRLVMRATCEDFTIKHFDCNNSMEVTFNLNVNSN